MRLISKLSIAFGVLASIVVPALAQVVVAPPPPVAAPEIDSTGALTALTAVAAIAALFLERRPKT